MVIGLGAALLAAVLFGGGAVMQAVAARRGPLVSRLMGLVVLIYVARLGAAPGLHRDGPAVRRAGRHLRLAGGHGDRWPPGWWASRSRSGTGSRSAYSSEAWRSWPSAQVPSAPTGSTPAGSSRSTRPSSGSCSSRSATLRVGGQRGGVLLGCLGGLAYAGSPIATRSLVDAGVGLADDPSRAQHRALRAARASGCTPSRCGEARSSPPAARWCCCRPSFPPSSAWWPSATASARGGGRWRSSASS